MVGPLNRVEAISAIGRSPPGYRWPSIDPAVHLNPLSERGLADVCPDDALRSGWAPLSQTEFTTSDDGTRKEQPHRSKRLHSNVYGRVTGTHSSTSGRKWSNDPPWCSCPIPLSRFMGRSHRLVSEPHWDPELSEYRSRPAAFLTSLLYQAVTLPSGTIGASPLF